MRYSFGNLYFYLYRANWVKVKGTKYQTPFALIIDEEDGEIKFGEVFGIEVEDANVFFEFVPLHTLYFCKHFNAYALARPPMDTNRQNYFINHKDILDFHPHGIYTSQNVLANPTLLYVVLRYDVFID